jgi:hypothetical protein
MGNNFEGGSPLLMDDSDESKVQENGANSTDDVLLRSCKQELEDTQRSLLVLQLENGELLQSVHSKQKEVESCREDANAREAEHAKEIESLNNEMKSLKLRLEDRSVATRVGERVQKFLKLSRPPRLIFCNSILRGARGKELKILKTYRKETIWNLSKYRARMACLDSRCKNTTLKKKQLEREAKSFRKTIARLSRIEKLYKAQVCVMCKNIMFLLFGFFGH